MKKQLFFLLLASLCVPTPAAAKSHKPQQSLFDADSVIEIRIQLTQCNAWDSLLYYKEKSQLPHYMQANVSINGTAHYACGVRIKGESSYEFYPGKKKSFKIKLNHYIKGQKIAGSATFNLNNGFKDPSFMREKLFLDILKREGIPAPRCCYANLYVNNEPFGLYLLVENIDKPFMQLHFGNDDGSLYKGEPQAYYQYLGNDSALYVNKYCAENGLNDNLIRNDLVQLIRCINDSAKSEPEYVTQLDKVLNMQNLIKIFAVTNILGNIDAYNMLLPHNHFVYQNTENNRFEWIPYDTNYAFGAWSPSFSLLQAESISLYWNDRSYPRPLLKAIFEHNTYRKAYTDFAKAFLTQKWTPLQLDQLTDSLALKIRKYVYQDHKKMYSNQDFEKNIKETIGNPLDAGAFIPGLLSFYTVRRNFLLKELKK